MCRGLKLVKTPAKKIPDKSGQRKINQSQHSQVLADLPPALVFDVADTGANRKRMIFFVKHAAVPPRTCASKGLLRLNCVGPKK